MIGNGPGGGHAWVVDGYDSNDLFHMNWGWGGTDNGWYDLSEIVNFGYGSYEFALIDIRPKKLIHLPDPNWVLSGTQTNDYYIYQASDYIKSTKIINDKYLFLHCRKFHYIKIRF